jgi:NAD(P)H-nitrite reductase large subunit
MNTVNRTKKGARVVCFCYNVSEEEIIEAIQKGANTLMEVRRETNANTGCGGCGEDVKKLLRKHAGAKPVGAKESQGNEG